MIRLWKGLNSFWQFALMLILVELLGFGFRWLYGVTGAFLHTPMWHGWFFAILYCIVWACAAIAFPLSWFFMYEYIFGGVFIALSIVYLTVKDQRRSEEQTLCIDTETT